MPKIFVAFGSQDKTLRKTIAEATERASEDGPVKFVPWTAEDGSGSPVSRTVDSWLQDAEGLIADVTHVNDNVTYEIGFAVGAGKSLRLIRNSGVGDKEIKAIGLFDGLIFDEFRTGADLEQLLRDRGRPVNKWARAAKNRRQPVYVLSPPTPDMQTTKLFSAVKKQTRFKFRSFKSWEIGRLTAHEVWEQVSASFGVVVTWQLGDTIEVLRNNQRAAFAYGIARGLGIPAILMAHNKSRLPADLGENASRWLDLHQFDGALRALRNDVQDELNEYDEQEQLPLPFLDAIQCGDAAAENEQDQLKYYFLETEEFKRTLNGEANLIVGRKGSGKSAIFLQVRDRIRHDKRNIVVDLSPEGYQLIKLKEMMLELQGLGARKEFVAAFWQYVLWLEIAYKLLEKDERAAKNDSSIAARYDHLKAVFQTRVDTGANDFSERLRLLTEIINGRFEQQEKGSMKFSSATLQTVYGADVATIRDEVLSYLKIKGTVLFLFDNLDRMRTPSGFDDDDAVIIVGLVEAMQEIAKRFRRDQIDFRWVVFIRSDVYEFVVKTMADYGKLAQQMLEWNDRDLLKKILRNRILASAPDRSDWSAVWPAISEAMVGDKEAIDFLVDGSLMRPRYLIRLFDAAKRRAVNLGREKISQDDYRAALVELGWVVMEDIDRELTDVLRNADALLYDISQLDRACGIQDLMHAVEKRVGATDLRERAIDVLLWSGAIGICTGAQTYFIYGCGYKLAYLRSLMSSNPHAEVSLHPTLRNLFVAAD